MVFIGHVDAGKSTIGGQILFLTGGVDERTIQKYERCVQMLVRADAALCLMVLLQLLPASTLFVDTKSHIMGPRWSSLILFQGGKGEEP